jgi:predicted HTH domain antitoxin
MTVVLELPSDIEKVLRSSGTDPSRAAKESLLVELYRQRQITHHQLGQALDLSRYEVDGVLKRHGVPLDLSAEELHAEIDSLRRMGRP